MFSTAVSGVLLPKITMMVANNASDAELSEIMIKIGRVQYVIMALILSGFVLYGQAFINLWAGSNYSDAYLIVLLVMVPITVPLIQNVGIAILQAKNMQGFRSVVYIAIAVLNVIASIPLAKIWGGFGCALATGVSLTLGNIIIMNIYYHRRIGLNIPLFWKNIIGMTIPVLIALLCGYGINSLIIQDRFLLLASKIVIYSIVYALIMWFFGLNMYEKDLFISPLKRIVKKIAQRG
jgi:O-antigen/teichoic acid export membrane protein